MADSDKKVNLGGADDKPKEPESLSEYADKNLKDDLTGPLPPVEGADAKKDDAEKSTPDGDLKITGVTFIKGKEQAAGKKEPEAAKVDAAATQDKTPIKKNGREDRPGSHYIAVKTTVCNNRKNYRVAKYTQHKERADNCDCTHKLSALRLSVWLFDN